MVWPSADDRCFVKELNALSSKHSSAGFGDPGMLSRVKAQRQLAFAKAANLRWPELGKLKTVQEKGRDERGGCQLWILESWSEKIYGGLRTILSLPELLQRCQGAQGFIVGFGCFDDWEFYFWGRRVGFVELLGQGWSDFPFGHWRETFSKTFLSLWSNLVQGDARYQ